MLYAFIGEDTPDPGRRLAAREAHLAHIAALGDRVRFAGPFLDEAGGMVGSLVVIEAESREEAEAVFAADPYMQAGVFASHSVRPWCFAVNNIAGA